LWFANLVLKKIRPSMHYAEHYIHFLCCLESVAVARALCIEGKGWHVAA